MQKNLDKLGGLVHSQRILLALTQKGVSREEAYALVQRNAMKVWKTAFEGGVLSEREGDFRALLGADAEVSAKLTSAELDALFDLSYHFKHVDDIFERVFAS